MYLNTESHTFALSQAMWVNIYSPCLHFGGIIEFRQILEVSECQMCWISAKPAKFGQALPNYQCDICANCGSSAERYLSTRGPETGGLLQGDVRRQRVDFWTLEHVIKISFFYGGTGINIRNAEEWKREKTCLAAKSPAFAIFDHVPPRPWTSAVS